MSCSSHKGSEGMLDGSFAADLSSEDGLQSDLAVVWSVAILTLSLPMICYVSHISYLSVCSLLLQQTRNEKTIIKWNQRSTELIF